MRSHSSRAIVIVNQPVLNQELDVFLVERERKRAKESVIDHNAIIILCKSLKWMNSFQWTKPAYECHLGTVPIWRDVTITDRYHQLLINSPVLPSDMETLMISQQIIIIEKQTPLAKNITGGDWLGSLIPGKLPVPKKIHPSGSLVSSIISRAYVQIECSAYNIKMVCFLGLSVSLILASNRFAEAFTTFDF